jgi:hypothetical protein
VPIPEIARLVSGQRGIDPGRAQLLAALAQGAPGRALAAELEPISLERDRMAVIDGALELSVWLRDQIVCALGGDETQIANLDKKAELLELADRRGLGEVLRRARVLERTRRLLLEPYNYNPLMIVEQLCLGLAGHEPGAAG